VPSNRLLHPYQWHNPPLGGTCGYEHANFIVDWDVDRVAELQGHRNFLSLRVLRNIAQYNASTLGYVHREEGEGVLGNP